MTAVPNLMPPQSRTPVTAARSVWVLAGWVLGIVIVGAGVGLLFPPGAWFAALYKPTWNPPAGLFAPVWTLLYILMGISIWLVRREDDASIVARNRASAFFIVQLALNLAWTPLFFGLHSPFLAFIEICVLWCAVGLTPLQLGKIRALAGYLFLPYLLWVSFALVLNGTIWLMNT
jgi:translocator protein